MAKPNQAHEQTMEEILASIRRMIADDPTAKPSLAGAAAAAAGETSPPPPANVSRLFVVDEAKPAETPPVEPTVETEAAPVAIAAVEPLPAVEPAASNNVVELAIAQAMEEARIEVRDGGAAKEAPPAEVKREIHIDLGLDVKEEAPIAPSEVATVAPLPQEPPAAERPREPAAPAIRRHRYVAPARSDVAAPELRSRIPPLMSPGTDAAVAAAFNQLATTMLSGSGRTVDELVADLLRPMLSDWLDDNLPPLVERLVREEIERVARGRR